MTSPFGRQRFLTLPFDIATMGEVLAEVRTAAAGDTFRYVVTPNVDHVVRLHRADAIQPAIRRAFDRAWLILCDSRILALLAGWSGLALPLVPGSDLTARLLQDERFSTLTFHVVGGTAQTFEALRARFPRNSWSQYIPGFGVLHDPAEQQAITESIVAADADVVFMAIGYPQSEVVCARVRETGQARGVGLCIGASLEFITGEKTRAPQLMQRLKLEWLFRLLSEPRRLWRRYLVEGPRILAIWLRSRSAPDA